MAELLPGSSFCRWWVAVSFTREFEGLVQAEVVAVAVAGLGDAPLVALAEAVAAVRDAPAPLGLEAERLAGLSALSAQLHGVLLCALTQASPAASGCRTRADLLTTPEPEHGEIPLWRAGREAGLAERLDQLPGLLSAVADGRSSWPPRGCCCVRGGCCRCGCATPRPPDR